MNSIRWTAVGLIVMSIGLSAWPNRKTATDSTVRHTRDLDLLDQMEPGPHRNRIYWATEDQQTPPKPRRPLLPSAA